MIRHLVGLDLPVYQFNAEPTGLPPRSFKSVAEDLRVAFGRHGFRFSNLAKDLVLRHANGNFSRFTLANVTRCAATREQ